jgi:hypothetical protein
MERRSDDFSVYFESAAAFGAYLKVSLCSSPFFVSFRFFLRRVPRGASPPNLPERSARSPTPQPHTRAFQNTTRAPRRGAAREAQRAARRVHRRAREHAHTLSRSARTLVPSLSLAPSLPLFLKSVPPPPSLSLSRAYAPTRRGATS